MQMPVIVDALLSYLANIVENKIRNSQTLCISDVPTSIGSDLKVDYSTVCRDFNGAQVESLVNQVMSTFRLYLLL